MEPGSVPFQRLTDRYFLLERIGRGGVGEVYRGWQQALERPVAIKLLRPELTRNASVLTRFEREARTACRLNHPNVVTVYDVGEADDGSRFLVMELLQGETLADLMAHRGALPVDVALGITRQIVRGMGAGQGVGLVHRDLKPENIFLVGGRLVKILDFGLATLRDAPLSATPRETPSHAVPQIPGDGRETFTMDGEARAESSHEPGRLTSPGTIMGTPRYAPPEQALGWEADARSDLYSFGCILFEMLAGRPPFLGRSASEYIYQHIHTTAPSLASVAPEVPRPLTRIVDRLLNKSPSARYADWAALAEALRRLEGVEEKAAPFNAANDESPRPTEPFRFLHPFTFATRNIFFGRDRDARRFRELWESADRPPVVLLTGASGVGKSSFIGARVLPGLRDTGHKVLRVLGGAGPLEALATAAARELARTEGGVPERRTVPDLLDALRERSRRPIAVLFDQVEELFTLGDASDALSFQVGMAALLGGSDGSVRFVLSVREDYLGALLRSLHPLPVDEICRTFPLPPLGADDLCAALEGPGAEGLPVAYAPFAWEPGLVSEIVRDLLSDASGEVAPRVQAVGSRLWAMLKDSPSPVITAVHYRDRLGGSRGILARILDEAVADLDAADRAVAKELLRALTHLPGSPTSRPAPESELAGHAADADRRAAVLRRLENRWRVIQGYNDHRWPDQRTYRIAHESLVARIQQYGEEGTGQNRARQLFHHGLTLWLQGGQRPEDLLSEQHFEEVQRHIEDLVLRTPTERAYYASCLRVYNEGWERRLLDQRRARRSRALQFTLVPLTLVGLGALLGQAPVGFLSLRVARLELASALGVPATAFVEENLRGADLAGLDLSGADLSSADLRNAELGGATLRGARLVRTRLEGADLSGVDLRGADLTGAGLWGARLTGAWLDGASVDAWRDGADFAGARYDSQTQWGQGQAPAGALGPGGMADGVIAEEVDLAGLNLGGLSATGANLTRAELTATRLPGARLDRADLSGAVLHRANLAGASLLDARLSGADLSGADLGNAAMRGADLERANLASANLRHCRGLGQASLRGAVADRRTTWPIDVDPEAMGVLMLLPDADLGLVNLRGVNLREVEAQGLQLRGADLSGADLRGADLRSGDLSQARLVDATLVGARLDGANLCAADLTDADLTGATFAGAKACESTRWPGAAPPPDLAR